MRLPSGSTTFVLTILFSITVALLMLKQSIAETLTVTKVPLNL